VYFYTHMRGQQALFDALLKPKQQPSLPNSPKKGRSEEFIRKRNICLVYRYYFYVKLQGKPYHDTLDLLELEFFISKRMIIVHIDNNYSLLKGLFVEKPDLKDLKNSFSWMSWN
jgi:hypothetical protein